MKRLLALILAAAPGSLLAAEGGPLSLARATDDVLARYPTVDAAQAALDAARARTEQSAAARLPQVGAEGYYEHFSLRPHIVFGSQAFFTTVQDGYNADLSARQLLTDFGRTDALVELARAGELSARDALEATRSQLGYQAIQEFYGTILLRQTVAVADEELRSLDEALRVSQRKFEGGTATRFDVLTTQVRLNAARNRRTDAGAALLKQEAALRALLGWAPETPLDLQGDLGSSPAPPPPGFASLLAEALRDRPEMKLRQDAAEAAERRVDAAGRANRPEISAQAQGGVENGQLPALYANKGYVNAGVGFSVPLFTGRRISGERAEAKADLRSAQAQVEELNRTIGQDVQSALADLGAAEARLGNADTLVAQAEEALALARTRYANGVITNFEMLDAQSAARAAELSRLQARYDRTLAAKALDRAVGRPPAP